MSKKNPALVWVPRGYYSSVKIKEDDVQMLILKEMDAFPDDPKYVSMTTLVTFRGQVLDWYKKHFGEKDDA